MSSALANRWYPTAAGSITITMSVFFRANEGVGAWSSSGVFMPNLSIVFPTGGTAGVPMEVVKDIISQHVENFVNRAMWNPRNQTHLQAIQGCLDKSEFGAVLGRGTTSTGVNLYFDGQFGDVYVG